MLVTHVTSAPSSGRAFQSGQGVWKAQSPRRPPHGYPKHPAVWVCLGISTEGPAS